MVPDQVESRQAPERKAGHHGLGRVGTGSVRSLRERQQFLQYKLGINSGQTAPAIEIGVGSGAVFLHPLLIGMNGDEDEGPHGLAGIQRLKGGRQVQAVQVLAVVEV